jgi:hypothetical protein
VTLSCGGSFACGFSKNGHNLVCVSPSETIV